MAIGTMLTNKYAEGYSGSVITADANCIERVETMAIERLKKLFECDYANVVRPHSGAQANI